MIKARIKKLENKKHLENSEQRDLERHAAEVKELLKEYNIDPEQHDFSDWTGVMRAWNAGLDAYLLTKYVDKLGNKIPASEMLLRREAYKINNQ